MGDTMFGRYTEDFLRRALGTFLVLLVCTILAAAVLALLLSRGVEEQQGVIVALVIGGIATIAGSVFQYRLQGALPAFTVMLAHRGTLARTGDRLSDALLRRQTLAPTLAPDLYVGQMGGPGWCVFRPGAEVMAHGTVPGCRVEIAGTLGLTFEGFDPSEPMAVEITRPDGMMRRRVVPPSSWGHHVDWTPLPTEPLGAYTIVGSQGDVRATGTVTVDIASEPLISVLPQSGPPGTMFKIVLAGFEPGSVVPLRLHLHVGVRDVIVDAERDVYGELTTYTYIATLRPVRVDGRGEATYELWTEPNETEGGYAVESEPPAQRGAAFFHRTFRIMTDPDAVYTPINLAS